MPVPSIRWNVLGRISFLSNWCVSVSAASYHLRVVISVLDPDDTEQADLRGGRSPWFATGRHVVSHDVTENLKCDALVVVVSEETGRISLALGGKLEPVKKS